MDISDFTQAPTEGAVYAKNEVPPFVISTGNSLLAVLSIGEEVIFRGSYSPNFEGKITIDFKGLYDDYLETIMPDSENTGILHSAYCREFTATFSVIAGEDTPSDNNSVSWNVANAVIDPKVSFADFSQQNFLTNQPIEKPTNYETPEWLTWLDLDGNTSLYAKFWPKSSDRPIEQLLFTTPAPGCYSINVSFGIIIQTINSLPSRLQGFYDIELRQQSGFVRGSQRYIYNERTGKEKYFCFVNALGGIDTLTCSGENVLQPETTHNVGRFNGRYTALDDTDDTRHWTQNTGMMPMRQRNWVYELLTAKQGAEKFDPQANDYYPIVVDSSEIDMSDNGQLVSANFGYILEEPDNAIPVTERNTDRYMHQSVADQAEALHDLTTAAELKFEPSARGDGFETEAVELRASKIYVEFIKTERQTVVEYLINGTTAGSFDMAEDDSPVVIAISGNATTTVQFTSEDDVLQTLELHYYPIPESK